MDADGWVRALLAGVCMRLALAVIWIFTQLVDRALQGFIILLPGLILFR